VSCPLQRPYPGLCLVLCCLFYRMQLRLRAFLQCYHIQLLSYLIVLHLPGRLLSMGCSTLSLTVFRLCDAFGIFSNTFPITLEDSQVFRFKLINFLNYQMKTTYCLLLFELANGDMLLSPTIQDSYLPG